MKIIKNTIWITIRIIGVIVMIPFGVTSLLCSWVNYCINRVFDWSDEWV